MQLGVNVPNFGPGTDPGVLREWARVVAGLGFDLLMVSDHVAVTPDVAQRYPEPFYDPFTTLSWLAGISGDQLRLGTTVLVLPYRHPLLMAKMLATVDVLSRGRVILGAGVGWLREEFEAVGAPPFEGRGAATDEAIELMRRAWTVNPVTFEGRHYRVRDVFALDRLAERLRTKFCNSDLTRPESRRPEHEWKIGDVKNRRGM